jgi:rhamnosyltransferase
VSVSVVIRCRNEEQHIGRLLTGLLRLRTRPDEVLIVDSGSTDATVSIASAFPVEVLHISPEDFSFGAACNLGCEKASGDYVVFISAHAYPVFDTWLDRLIAPFDADDVALTYGRQLGAPTAKFSEQRLFGRWFPAESVSRQRDPFCNNANAAVRRSVWESIRYDPHLTGLEDLDWARRAVASGYVLSYVADAPVVHVHEESFGQVVNRYRREAVAHKQIDETQHMTVTEAARLATANIASDLLSARRDGLLGQNLLSIPAFRLAQFYGTFRGFNQRGPVTALLRQRFFYPDAPSASFPAGVSEAAGEPGAQIDYEAPLDSAELS